MLKPAILATLTLCRSIVRFRTIALHAYQTLNFGSDSKPVAPFFAYKQFKGQRRCWRFETKVIPFKRLLFLPPEVQLPSLDTPNSRLYALCVWVVKLEANGASMLAFSCKHLGVSYLDCGGLRTLGMLPAAWKTGETMQRATNLAVLQCVRCVQVTSLRDDFWSTFSPPTRFMF